MRTSTDGLVAIMAYEALALVAYNDDGAGVWTIGVGHTAAAGPPAPASGMTITLADAIRLFRSDIEKCERAVLAAVKVPLSQQQFDALVSWQLNCGSIANATLTTRLNEGDYEAAANELLRWNKSKGRVLAGLTKRRQAEREMFLNGNYGTAPVLVREKNKPKRNVSREEILAMIREVEGPGQLEGKASEAVSSVDQPDAIFVAAPADDAPMDYPANPASAILPRYRPRQSAADTRAVLDAYRNLLPATRQSDAVILLAVRGYYDDSFGVAGRNDRGFYDDAVFVIEPDHVHNFNGNTDPSIRRNGIATLVAPQVVLYKPGYHGFQSAYGHPAFRQESPVTVARDGGGEQSDRGRARFWINLHRGGNSRTSSEGCQTIPPTQWAEFKQLIDGLLRQYRQDDFCYLLITEEQRTAALATPAKKSESIIVASAGGQPKAPQPAFILVLRRDDTAPPSARVSALQMSLKNLGYELGKVDGRFGSLTEGALLAFQADNALPKTGELDAATQAMLDKGPMRPLDRVRTGATEADVVAAGSTTVRDAIRSRILSWVTMGLGALGVGNSAVINASPQPQQSAAAIVGLLEEVSRLGAGTPSPEALRRLADAAKALRDGMLSGASPDLLQALQQLKASLPADAAALATQVDRIIAVATRSGLKPGGMNTIFDILPSFFADGTVLQTAMKGLSLVASSTLPGFAGSAALVGAGLLGRILANRIAEARVKDHREGKNLGN